MQRIKQLTVQLWEYVLEDLDNEKSGNSLARLQGEWVEVGPWGQWTSEIEQNK